MKFKCITILLFTLLATLSEAQKIISFGVEPGGAIATDIAQCPLSANPGILYCPVIPPIANPFLAVSYNGLPALPMGAQGLPGKDGKDGIDGLSGTNGINGKDGTNGKDGINGVNGLDGKDGLPGVGVSFTLNCVGEPGHTIPSGFQTHCIIVSVP